MQRSFQIELPEQRLNELKVQIQQDFTQALSDHNLRMERFRRYYQRWRNRVDPPLAGEEDASNVQIPLTQWQVYAKWAREVNLLFGDDTQIIGKPVGPTDQRNVEKVGRYMTWRVFNSMKALNPISTFMFRKILWGRSHAYSPWRRDTYRVKKGEQITSQVAYEGPGFDPLWPDDLVVPAELAQTIHDFSWIIRKYRSRPTAFWDGADSGIYSMKLVRQFWSQIENWGESNTRQRPMDNSEPVQQEADASEGVIYEGGLSARGTLQVHEWYSTIEIKKTRGSRYQEKEVVIRYLPEIMQIVGVQDLMDLYPMSRHRRPFVEASLTKDGSYWCMGFGELLEMMESELTVNHNLFTEAGEFSVGPVMFYRPASGFDPKAVKLEPKMAIPCEDPAGVQQMQVRFDPNYSVIKEQACLAVVERVTGLSDQSMGRSIDRPNAPKTATGQVALLEEGNLRVSLDMMFLREDMGAILDHFWMLEGQFTPEQVFFRATEEDSNLFDVKSGFANMTVAEFNNRYDFDIEFATSHWSREAEKEKDLALYQIDLQNPLIIQNPRALWMVTNRVHKALGDDNFADVVPQPPDLGMPKQPKEEWTLMLQGEDVHVNPLDNDELHIMDHLRRVQEEKDSPNPDEKAINEMVAHMIEHKGQSAQKAMMQALASRLATTMANVVHNNPFQQQQPQPGGQPGGELPGAPAAQGAVPPVAGADQAPTGPGTPQSAGSNLVDQMRARLPGPKGVEQA